MKFTETNFDEILRLIEELFRRLSSTPERVTSPEWEIMTKDEVCHVLQLSERQLSRIVKAGKIRTFRPCRRKIYFLRSDVMAWALEKKG